MKHEGIVGSHKIASLSVAEFNVLFSHQNGPLQLDMSGRINNYSDHGQILKCLVETLGMK